MTIMEAFFQFFESSTFSIATILFILGFIIWELPRSVKIMSEEYTQGVYPKMGRISDFFVFVIGLAVIVFLYAMNGLREIVDFLRYETYVPLLAIIIIAVPVLILLGFLKRFVSRIDKNESITVFAVHNFLDLAHTVFFICFCILFIPTLMYVLFGWL